MGGGNFEVVHHLFDVVRYGIKGIAGFKGVGQGNFGIAMAAEVEKQDIKLFFKIPDLLKPDGGTTTRTMYKSNPLMGIGLLIGGIVEHMH